MLKTIRTVFIVIMCFGVGSGIDKIFMYAFRQGTQKYLLYEPFLLNDLILSSCPS